MAVERIVEEAVSLVARQAPEAVAAGEALFARTVSGLLPEKVSQIVAETLGPVAERQVDECITMSDKATARLIRWIDGNVSLEPPVVQTHSDRIAAQFKRLSDSDEWKGAIESGRSLELSFNQRLNHRATSVELLSENVKQIAEMLRLPEPTVTMANSIQFGGTLKIGSGQIEINPLTLFMPNKTSELADSSMHELTHLGDEKLALSRLADLFEIGSKPSALQIDKLITNHPYFPQVEIDRKYIEKVLDVRANEPLSPRQVPLADALLRSFRYHAGMQTAEQAVRKAPMTDARARKLELYGLRNYWPTLHERRAYTAGRAVAEAFGAM